MHPVIRSNAYCKNTPQSDNTLRIIIIIIIIMIIIIIIIIIILNNNATVLLKAANIGKRKYQSTAILHLKIEMHCNIDLLANL